MPGAAGAGTFKKTVGSTPGQVYGSNLKFWYNSQAGTSNFNTVNAKWEDQVASVDLDEDPGDNDFVSLTGATYFAGSIVGAQFRPSDVNNLGRRLQSSSSVFDNIWSGSGNKNIAFACKMETMSWLGGIGLSAIVSKGLNNPGQTGWGLFINQSGSLKFKAVKSNGQTWDLDVNSYYATRQLIIGHITFSGNFSLTPSITIRLWSGTSWQTVSFNTFGSSLGVIDDSASKFAVGNNSDETFNEPLHGAFGALWFTKPALTSINETYLARYI